MPRTFRQLFDDEAAYVLGRLRWLGVPPRDRPDVAQDIFANVARHLDSLDPARPVRPWLLAITCNAARDYFKRASVRREQLAEVEAFGAELLEDRVHERFEAADLVRRLLSTLAYDSREVLVLVALEERPVPEVAELLRLNVKTVESRLARAREQLAQALERVRAAERRRIGFTAAMPMILTDPDELLGAARAAHEDLQGEVDELRARMHRAFQTPPAASAATPAATWAGLAFVGFIAGAGALHALTDPHPAIYECPALADVVALPASSPPSSSTSSITTVIATSSTATPSSSSSAPAPAPSPCARTMAKAPGARAELDEQELLSLARRSMNEHDTRRAKAFLLRHERAYPHGSLAPERAALLARLAGSP